MKRRIIVDMSALYEHQSIVFGGSINMNTVRHKGYMVLGAYLHLVQDLRAHRAEVTANMLYKTDDGIQCYGYNTMVASKENSIICANHIKGMKEQNYDKYWELYYKIKNEKSIPIIKLKNYLVETDSKNVNTLIDIYCNGGVYYCTAAQAYEDNPFFYQDRYSTAYDFTCAYIDRMYNDKGY